MRLLGMCLCAAHCAAHPGTAAAQSLRLPEEVRQSLLDSAVRSAALQSSCQTMGYVEARVTRLGNVVDKDGIERFRERWTIDLCSRRAVFVVSWHRDADGVLRHSLKRAEDVADEPMAAESRAAPGETESALAAIGRDVRKRSGCEVVRVAGRNIATLRDASEGDGTAVRERWTVDACGRRSVYFIHFGVRGEFVSAELGALRE
jgi:hypothetical protein